MDKVLRVLAVLILILSAVALFFAYQLFEKRELLTQRNRAFEDQFIKLAKTIEAEDPTEGDAPQVMKDNSEVSDRELDNPEKLSMLEGYPINLEQQNLPTLDFGSNDKRIQLRSFYALTPEGKYDTDPVDKRPRSQGPGTMRELTEQLLDRAKTQQASLNKTRAELTKMRERFTGSIDELNKLKTDGRVTKVELKGEREKVATWTSEKTELEGRVARLNTEKRELTAEIADLKSEAEQLKEEKITLAEDLSKSTEYAKQLEERLKTGTSSVALVGREVVAAASAPSAGDKGKIIQANDELKFAIVELSNDAMDELLGSEREGALPQLEMNVRRTGLQRTAGEFVTRIKLRQSVRGKNFVVADILNDWQQVPVEKGDVVFF